MGHIAKCVLVAAVLAIVSVLAQDGEQSQTEPITKVFQDGDEGKYVALECEVKEAENVGMKGVGSGETFLNIRSVNGNKLLKPMPCYRMNVEISPLCKQYHSDFWLENTGRILWVGAYVRACQIGSPSGFSGNDVAQVCYQLEKKLVVLSLMENEEYHAKKQRIEKLCMKYNNTVVDCGRFELNSMALQALEGTLENEKKGDGSVSLVIKTEKVNGDAKSWCCRCLKSQKAFRRHIRIRIFFSPMKSRPCVWLVMSKTHGQARHQQRLYSHSLTVAKINMKNRLSLTGIPLYLLR